MNEELLVWDHFKINAEQRLKSFNFFLVVAVFVNGSVLNAINTGLRADLMLVLGVFLCILSIVFWLADNRSKHLLRLSVDALLEMEKSYRASFQLFRLDKEKRNDLIRYTTAITTLLAVQFAFGLGVIIYAAYGITP